jgi:2-dehydro-3-deoxy-D-gluconate 5-dehydrogenase
MIDRDLGAGQVRVDTELTRDARRQVPALHKRFLARTPTGRWDVPHDLAGVAVFLASAASDFVTGAAIPVDDGFPPPAMSIQP